MDLKKELLEFLEANNNFGLEQPEKIVDIYIEVCKKEKGINYFKKHEPINNNKITAILIKAEMTDEQIEALVSEINRISEWIGINLTIQSKEDEI